MLRAEIRAAINIAIRSMELARELAGMMGR
jgi:hypothetical protein